MALIRRISRLFAADMHAVLDQIEEPEVVLRQAVREMEEELARQRQREKWLSDEIEAGSGRRESFEAELREIDASLDVCFSNQNEALARKLTRRKLETLALVEQAEVRRAVLAKRLDELVALIKANTDQLDSMRQKAAMLAAEAPATDACGRSRGIDDDDVEVAYLREKQARMPS